MDKAKKQHYVPQFLLRHFGAGKKSKAKVWVLDKQNVKTYRASVRDVGHENRFYEYHGEHGDLELEGLLSIIDGHGARVVRDIVKSGKLPQSQDDRITLSYILAVQMLRTPSIRKDMENIREIIVRKFGPDVVARPGERPVGDFGPDDDRFSSLNMIRQAPEFASVLRAKSWILCRAPAAVPFIVSDNPIARHNMVERPGRGTLGLMNEGIEIYMPLSTNYIIHLICPKSVAAALATPELEGQYSPALKNDTPIQYVPENAEFVNSLQVVWAERFVFARELGHLKMPLDMLRTNPELRYGPGVRQRLEDA